MLKITGTIKDIELLQEKVDVLIINDKCLTKENKIIIDSYAIKKFLKKILLMLFILINI